MTTTFTVEAARRYLAEEIRVCANIRSRRLVEALATVPRESFLPPGPWTIRGVGDISGAARVTDDANPRHVYHDLAVAIDSTRNLYNGQPSLIARWLDDAGLGEGQRVVHVGCGAGYFTALMASVVGPTGRVDAVDVDAGLATQAAVNLAAWRWVSVSVGNGAARLASGANVIIVHAGATHVLDVWMDSMADGGRLVMPLTIEVPGMPTGIGKGLMMSVRRDGETWTARVHPMMPVAIYSLKEVRDESLGTVLGQAMMTGAVMKVQRVRRDSHEPTPSCIVHGTSNCLSA